MARWKLIESEIKNLVNALGGSEIDKENTRLCVEFALSNLKYHNFLDTDEKKVERSKDGIVEKFVIHNLQSKAELFSEYCQLFLEGPLSTDDDKVKTKTHYSVLQLLLLLSHSPTNNKTLHSRIESGEKETHVYKKFDWKSYLLEGFEETEDYDNDDDSSYEEEDDELDDGDRLAFSRNPLHHGIKGEGDGPKAALTGPRLLTPAPISTSTDLEDAWEEETRALEEKEKLNKCLEESVMPRYWSRDQGQSRIPPSSFLFQWNNYLCENSPIDLTKNQVLLTEYQIIREVLWVLNGCDDLFAFAWDGFEYHANEDIVVSHLAEASLHNQLEELARYGSMVRSVIEYVQSISAKNESAQPTADPPCLKGLFSMTTITQTHQAFASTINSQLASIRSALVDLEKLVLKQEETFTLSKLKLLLDPHLKHVRTLFGLFIEGVVRPHALPPSSSQQPSFLQKLSLEYLGKVDGRLVGRDPKKGLPLPSSGLTLPTSGVSLSPSQLACHLLCTVYESLLNTQRLELVDNSQMSSILDLWMSTCKPYLDILESWLTFGSFSDPYSEFIIKRNSSWETLGEKFWTDSVKVDDYSMSRFNFLMPFLKEIVATGKSIKLLSSIADRKSVVSFSGSFSSLHDFYANCLLEDSTGSDDDDKCDKDDDDDGQSTCEQSDKLVEEQQDKKSASINRLLSVLYPTIPPEDKTFVETFRVHLAGSDPLLFQSFLNAFEPSLGHSAASKSIHPGCATRSNKDPTGRKYAKVFSTNEEGFLHPKLEEALRTKVMQRYSSASSFLLEELRGRYCFNQHLDVIRKFFLMECGRIMFDFYSSLFNAMNEGKEWMDPILLRYFLSEALKDETSEVNDRLTIGIEKTSKPLTSVTCLECIHLDYKTSWPCNIVVNSDCMAIYAQIFRFLLQIKWAKYSLDSLRFSDLPIGTSSNENDPRSPSSNANLNHRMLIFKMKVLHFVNSFHNYIMTRILHSVGLEFQSKLDRSSDLDELLATHDSYVSTLLDRCLLHPKMSMIRDMVLRVLQVALDVSRVWKSPDISVELLEEMEKDFNRCLQFLSILVNSVLSRGSFAAHLELLAFTLQTCSQPHAE